jgi:mRNA interferase RelE/StbE
MLELRYTKPALKALRKAPQNVSRRIRRELEVISKDPSAYRGDWKPLTNSSFWRLRVGNWRAICEIREQELVLLVLKIGSRGDVYK